MNKEEIIKRINEINFNIRNLDSQFVNKIQRVRIIETSMELILNVPMLKASLLVEKECLEERLKELLNEVKE